MPDAGQSVSLPMLDSAGRQWAEVSIWPIKKGEMGEGEELSLFEASEEIAAEFGEQTVQLRERERYEYEIRVKGTIDHTFALIEEGGVTRSRRHSNEGTIETRDFCGTLPLRLCKVGEDSNPIAMGLVEVRSMKLSYREDYRSMLASVAKETAALLLDSQSRTQQRLESLWNTENPLVEQQLEFLRHTLDSPDFAAAVDQILRFPHLQLERESEWRNFSRAGKIDRNVVRQLTQGGGDRVCIPETHPAFALGLTSVPRLVEVPVGSDYSDTAENRFIKMILESFQHLLTEVMGYLKGENAYNSGKAALKRDCQRLCLKLDGILSHSFFQQLSRPETLPLGSPVLQQKAGYRELYHFWLQFHASAQLAWDGGSEVWRGGARNVATLYEYWLFFQLEKLFRKKFKCDQPLHKLLVDNTTGIARMILKRGTQLRTPVKGVWSEKAGRKLKAQFMFNKKFTPSKDRTKQSSWTRGVQPDYTISIWPADFEPDEAEEHELMVHIHFDAKYRVEVLPGFEAPSPKESDDELIKDRAESAEEDVIHSTTAKYADLLKMHAYRDAIRRTGGAYVLYPGNSAHDPLSTFHEVLPGLGAFSVKPDEHGSKGIDSVSTFLDDVIDHLSNRTTTYERIRFHSGESLRFQENTVTYGFQRLPERDQFDVDRVSPPPDEHKILVVWSKDNRQLEKWSENGIAHVRLGNRPGGLPITMELSEVRHILVRRGPKVFGGLLKLSKNQFTIHTGSELTGTFGIFASSAESIYAVFHVEEDIEFRDAEWDEEKIWDLIATQHSQKNPSEAELNPRRSADPKILTLKSLLKQMAGGTPKRSES